jgi:hypothetical protein
VTIDGGVGSACAARSSATDRGSPEATARSVAVRCAPAAAPGNPAAAVGTTAHADWAGVESPTSAGPSEAVPQRGSAVGAVPGPPAVSPVSVSVDEVVLQVDGAAAATAGAAVVAGASSSDDAVVSVDVAVGVLSGTDSVDAVDGVLSLSAAAVSGSGSAAVSVVAAESSDEAVESDVASGAGSSAVDDVVVASSLDVEPVVSVESGLGLGVSVVAGSSAVAVSEAAASACVVAGCSSAWAETDVPTAMQA